MRAWVAVALLLAPMVVVPLPAAAQSGCATLSPSANLNNPHRMDGSTPVQIALRHNRPNSCIDAGAGCPEGGTTVTFRASPKPGSGVTVSFSPTTATATPTGATMEARSTATVRGGPGLPNATMFDIEFSAGCGAYLAKASHRFVTPPYIDVNATIQSRNATASQIAWSLVLVNRGPLTAFVLLVPSPDTEEFPWRLNRHAFAVLGTHGHNPNALTPVHVEVVANTTRRDAPLTLSVRAADNLDLEGATNETLVLFDPSTFRGHSRVPAPASTFFLAGLAAAVLALRKRPA